MRQLRPMCRRRPMMGRRHGVVRLRSMMSRCGVAVLGRNTVAVGCMLRGSPVRGWPMWKCVAMRRWWRPGLMARRWASLHRVGPCRWHASRRGMPHWVLPRVHRPWMRRSAAVSCGRCTSRKPIRNWRMLSTTTLHRPWGLCQGRRMMRRDWCRCWWWTMRRQASRKWANTIKHLLLQVRIRVVPTTMLRGCAVWSSMPRRGPMPALRWWSAPRLRVHNSSGIPVTMGLVVPWRPWGLRLRCLLCRGQGRGPPTVRGQPLTGPDDIAASTKNSASCGVRVGGRRAWPARAVSPVPGAAAPVTRP